MSKVIKRAHPPAAWSGRSWPELAGLPRRPAPAAAAPAPEGVAAADPAAVAAEARRAAAAAAAAGREEGFRLGYEEGRRRGYEEGLERAAAVMHEAEARMREVEAARASLSASLAEERAHLVNEARAEIARLAMAVARRVLERELASDPKAVSDLVARLLEEARGREAVVRVHPDDAPALGGSGGVAASFGKVEVVADPGVGRGGAVIETPGGTWDARLETRLGAAEAALRDGLDLGREEEPSA